jgi:hypothetical protein
MSQKKFDPVYDCIENVEPDTDSWTAWHLHFGYNQNMFAYFMLEHMKETRDFNKLPPKQRGQWKHIFNLYDDVKMNCKFLDAVFMDWPLFKMKYDIGNNYPTPDIMLYFKDEIMTAVESKTGFSSLSRPSSAFRSIYFTNEDNYYIINSDEELFNQFKYSREDYK